MVRNIREAGKHNQKQRGAVLLVALVLLVILTLIGVAVMESSVVQERMAGNVLDKTRAMQAAEMALREGERRVSQGPALTFNPDLDDRWWLAVNNSTWLSNGDLYIEYDVADARLANQPRYVIEYFDTVCDNSETPSATNCKRVYRITARGWGQHPNSSVMLQSIYARR